MIMIYELPQDCDSFKKNRKIKTVKKEKEKRKKTPYKEEALCRAVH